MSFLRIVELKISYYNYMAFIQKILTFIDNYYHHHHHHLYDHERRKTHEVCITFYSRIMQHVCHECCQITKSTSYLFFVPSSNTFHFCPYTFWFRLILLYTEGATLEGTECQIGKALSEGFHAP